MAAALNLPKHISFRDAQVGQAHALAGIKRHLPEGADSYESGPSRRVWRAE